jgi:hypothetical protein
VVRYSGPLSLFVGLYLCFRHRRHKAYQRVPDRLLSGVCGGAIEHHSIDHGLHRDPYVDQRSDGVCHVLIVAPQPVNPAGR